MEGDTITFLRSLCSKVKEIAILCDAYLEQEAKEKLKAFPVLNDEPKPQRQRLIPLTKWNLYHEWPTVAALRSMGYASYRTGADYFIRKAGRRTLICEKSFFEWVNMSVEQRGRVSQDMIRWRERFGMR